MALVLPNDRADLDYAAFQTIPLELLALALLLALAPALFVRLVRWLATIALTLLVAVKLADMAAFEAMSRPFNPVLDYHLLDAAWNIVSGAMGTAAAGLVVVGIVLGFILLFAAAFFAVQSAGRLVRAYRTRATGLAILVLAVGLVLPKLYPENRTAHFASHGSSSLARIHLTAFAASLKDIEDFRREAADDPARSIASEDLFALLRGKDVLMFFVESYGRTVLANAEYSGQVTSALESFEDMLTRQGYGSVSGYLTSPVKGGQSWLGHGSVLSGLWLDNQRRYNSLIVSDRATLVSDFARAGWRSVAVMPAITMAWPEGSFFKYDAIYDFARLEYRGLPFNWVTMPDQYTLSAFDRFERLREDRKPLFAEVALISSHAPWTPIPNVIPWDEVGDGSVFNEQASSGDTPRTVWSDPARVREQFRLSIEYALANLASYVEERLERDFVLIVLGDHQPARIITGESDNRDVPYHIISDDPEIIDRLAREWPVARGMMPDDGLGAEPMSAFRGNFVESFSRGTAPAGTDDGPAGEPEDMDSIGPT
jgi:hypothetical protein